MGLGAGVAEERRGRPCPCGRRPGTAGTTVAFFSAASYAASASKSDALDVRVGEGHVRAGAGHQVRVAGRGPAGDPAAVLVLLDEAVDQLARLLRA